MKRLMLISAAVVIFVSIFTYNIFASKPATHPEWITHPGRTNRYGCHYCRTNCERWGLEYGEYHCH